VPKKYCIFAFATLLSNGMFNKLAITLFLFDGAVVGVAVGDELGGAMSNIT